MRLAGRNWGFKIICPHCGDAPKDVKQWNRWRWLTLHIASKHTKGAGVKKVA